MQSKVLCRQAAGVVKVAWGLRGDCATCAFLQDISPWLSDLAAFYPSLNPLRNPLKQKQPCFGYNFFKKIKVVFQVLFCSDSWLGKMTRFTSHPATYPMKAIRSAPESLSMKPVGVSQWPLQRWAVIKIPCLVGLCWGGFTYPEIWELQRQAIRVYCV